VTGFGFTSRYKLKKTDEFSSVFNFRRRLSGEFLVIHYMPNSLEYPRIGVIVGKKTARLAVQRNYIKRVLRELFRLERHTMAGVDILVRPSKKFGAGDFGKIRMEFHHLLHQLREKSGGRKSPSWHVS
jgi:ribonuclease P protein component